MPNLFGIDLSRTIASAFRGQLLAGILLKRNAGTRGVGGGGIAPPGFPGGGGGTPTFFTTGTSPTETAYAFEGIIENRDDQVINGTLVSQRGEFVLILGGSLATGIEPVKGDRVIIEASTYTIIAVEERDPAGATFLCRVEI